MLKPVDKSSILFIRNALSDFEGKKSEKRYEFTTCHESVGSGLTSLKIDDWNGHEDDKDDVFSALSDLLDLYVQDQYKDLPDSGATEEKLEKVISAFTTKSYGKVVWNFASATWYGIFGIYIMSGLLAAFGERAAAERWRHFGWILFDYPFEKYRTDQYGDLDIVTMIIASNDAYREFPERFRVIGRNSS